MPSNSHTDSDSRESRAGCIYIVATPIGNLEDITLRALNTLRTVDLVAAEDTRHTGRLLSAHGIKTPLQAYHEHNETQATPRLLRRLSRGQSIALVSDAGTPAVSDPGYRLITEVLNAGFEVIPIPGVSAAVTAMSVSGLPTDAFYFLGFLPKKKAKREALLVQVSRIPATLIFYESPKRVQKLLTDVKNILGNRVAVLAREMTKLHEEFLRAPLDDIAAQLEQRQRIKGECTLLVAGYETAPRELTDDIRREIQNRLSQSDPGLSGLARDMSAEFGISRNKIYSEALLIQRQMQGDD